MHTRLLRYRWSAVAPHYAVTKNMMLGFHKRKPVVNADYNRFVL